MKLEQAQQYLDRVNRLFADISADDGPPSQLERDLLKEYVRRLYENLGDLEPVGQVSSTESDIGRVQRQETANKKPAALETKHQEPAPTRGESQDSSRASVPDVRRSTPAPAFAFTPSTAEALVSPQEQKAATAPPPANPAPRPAPRVIEIPAEVEADVRATERNVSAPTMPVREVEVAESPFAPSPSELPAKVRDLFAIESQGDLSDKLGGSAVPDLTRAMAINERILAQNDLFGGQRSELDEALRHLNSLDSYADAVSYLGGGAALKYDWVEEDRRPTARAFAKLVRRRYA